MTPSLETTPTLAPPTVISTEVLTPTETPHAEEQLKPIMQTAHLFDLPSRLKYTLDEEVNWEEKKQEYATLYSQTGIEQYLSQVSAVHNFHPLDLQFYVTWITKETESNAVIGSRTYEGNPLLTLRIALESHDHSFVSGDLISINELPDGGFTIDVTNPKTIPSFTPELIRPEDVGLSMGGITKWVAWLQRGYGLNLSSHNSAFHLNEVYDYLHRSFGINDSDSSDYNFALHPDLTAYVMRDED